MSPFHDLGLFAPLTYSEVMLYVFEASLGFVIDSFLVSSDDILSELEWMQNHVTRKNIHHRNAVLTLGRFPYWNVHRMPYNVGIVSFLSSGPLYVRTGLTSYMIDESLCRESWAIRQDPMRWVHREMDWFHRYDFLDRKDSRVYFGGWFGPWGSFVTERRYPHNFFR